MLLLRKNKTINIVIDNMGTSRIAKIRLVIIEVALLARGFVYMFFNGGF